MSNLPKTTHDIFNRPGDEGITPSIADGQAEEYPITVPSPEKTHFMTPGSEGSFNMGVNDPSYRQGYRCESSDIKAPNYVGTGGPHVDQTHVPASHNGPATPDMPGA